MELPNSVKQGKVRKGTHSCRECKRRKVRCIFASPSDVLCTMCKRRGSRCTSQWVTSDTDATSKSTMYISNALTPGSTSPDLVISTVQRGSRPYAERLGPPSYREMSRREISSLAIPGDAEVCPWTDVSDLILIQIRLTYMAALILIQLSLQISCTSPQSHQLQLPAISHKQEHRTILPSQMNFFVPSHLMRILRFF
jgi:hypothetical protein